MTVTNNEPQGLVDDTPVATPFLFIPQDSGDTGVRRPLPAGVGWIDCPAVLLLSEDGKLEVVPRCGVSYRVVALIGNAGTVPAENCFAEFYVDLAPRNQLFPLKYEKSRQQVSPYAHALGVSSLSVSQSKAGSELGWAISPRSYRFGEASNTCVRMRVFDLLHDSPAADYSSVTDRKVALRVFRPNFGGVWSGNEVDLAGGILGHVRIAISQDWALSDAGDHVPVPECTIVVSEFPTLPDRRVPIGEVQKSPVDDCAISFVLDQDEINNTWFAFFVPDQSDMLKVRVQKQADRGEADRSKFVLYRDGPVPAAPEPDIGLLRRVTQSIPTYWPASRKSDARILFRAINGLLP